jgi:hypothetical protein
VTVIGLLLGLVGISWITFALLPESRKEWALIPLGFTFFLVVTGIVVFEAFSSWILLSAITQRPVECAVAVIVFHLIIGIALWRSSR